jgi:glycosyltransferase involved in cell wall biosynthesis
VDIDFFKPGDETLNVASREMVFTGSMDWYPNEDAMLYFISDVLPTVLQSIPDATLTIVGRNPTARLRNAAKAAHITVTGTVDDVRPYIERAAVVIVPLRIGGGTRLKIFEALAMRKAVVSTSIGAEGLPLQDSRHILIANSSRSFAEQIIFLLNMPAERLRLGNAGRNLVRENFAWQQIAEKFAALCRQQL